MKVLLITNFGYRNDEEGGWQLAGRRHQCLDRSGDLIEMVLDTKNQGGKRIYNF